MDEVDNSPVFRAIDPMRSGNLDQAHLLTNQAIEQKPSNKKSLVKCFSEHFIFLTAEFNGKSEAIDLTDMVYCQGIRALFDDGGEMASTWEVKYGEHSGPHEEPVKNVHFVIGNDYALAA